MPSPTRAQVKTRFRILLDDPNGTIFNEAIFTEGLTEAYDALWNAAIRSQIPLEELVVNGIHLITGTPKWCPLTDGNILDLADYIRIQERAWGSTEKFTEMYGWDEIPQRDPSDRLVDYVWRNNTFYFVVSSAGAGSTTDREIQLAYRSSGTAPTNDNTVIPFDGSLSFLAKAAAAAVGATKGYDELAQMYHDEAYGQDYNRTGALGGEIKRITDQMIRSEQKVPLAIKPYSVYRSRLRRRVPYVAAQQPQGIGVGPAQFSTANGTITPTPNGVVTQFLLSYPVSTANVFRNGVLMTQPTDVAFGANSINFVAAQTPQLGDTITVEGWI